MYGKHRDISKENNGALINAIFLQISANIKNISFLYSKGK
jgi:hypothetical protein